jgi:hypothetical protein
MNSIKAEGEGAVTNGDGPAGPDVHVNFDAPAILRKWPSLNNQRRTEGTGPYLLFDGTLGEFIREFMAKPAPMRHLDEIQTSPQPPLGGARLVGRDHHRTRAASGYSLIRDSPLVTELDAARGLQLSRCPRLTIAE